MVVKKNTGKSTECTYAKTWNQLCLTHSREVKNIIITAPKRINPVIPGIVVKQISKKVGGSSNGKFLINLLLSANFSGSVIEVKVTAK